MQPSTGPERPEINLNVNKSVNFFNFSKRREFYAQYGLYANQSN